MKSGFLTSQIGYDLHESKRCFIRSQDLNNLSNKAVLIISEKENELRTFPISYWGEIWHSHFWVVDWSSFDIEGSFTLKVIDQGRTKFQESAVEVSPNLLWTKTIDDVVFSALDQRHELARNKIGFKDCGHHWREIPSHTGLLLGLLDLLELGFQHLTSIEVENLKRHIIDGMDLLIKAQDTAFELGFGDGGLVHEFPTVLHIIPGSVAQAAVVFAKAGRLLVETHIDLGKEYIRRGKKALEFLRDQCPPFKGGFYAAGHGAPDAFEVPGTWMTRDLMTMLWACVELWMAGSQVHQRIGAEIAHQLISRQVPRSTPEHGFFGHFYAFDNVDFTEKANTHHHWGHDTGGFLPHYVFPFVLMTRLWGYHPDNALWKQVLLNFAEGYFIPACNQNPFGILPMGVWKNEGLLTFSGPWHGCNVTLGFASALASQLEFVLGLPELRAIAVANLQWVAGLNSGVFDGCFDGCLASQNEPTENTYQAISLIEGIGKYRVRSWSGIKGTIVNGFSNNRQFQHENRPSRSTDGPLWLTDEDWIPHTGGFVSALAWLRETSFFSKVFKNAQDASASKEGQS